MTFTVDNSIGVKPAYEGWAYIWWLDAGKRRAAFARAFPKVEHILRKLGFSGWITSSNLEHIVMHKQIVKHGAVEYSRDAQHLYFKKEFEHV